MLITERSLRPDASQRIAPRTRTLDSGSLNRARIALHTLGKTLRTWGNPTAWACFALVGYVFVLAVLNLARYGLER